MSIPPRSGPPRDRPRPSLTKTPHTPLPPTRKQPGPVGVKRTPRLAFLHWTAAGSLEKGYCTDLFHFFVRLATSGAIQLTVLGEAQGRNAPPFPDLNMVRAGNFDAFISNGIWNADYLHEVHRLNKPLISVDHLTEGMPIDSVTFASRQPGEAIGKLLAETGHTDILFISRFRRDQGAVPGADPIIEDPTCAERRTSVQSGLLGTDVDFWPALPWLNAIGINNAELMAQRLERILKEMGRWPTALVVPSVELGVVAIEEFKRHGKRVPEDISCISFHAPPGVNEDEVAMSTMQFSWTQMATEAWRLLKERMDGAVPLNAPARHIEIPAKFVDRSTVLNRRPRQA